MADLRTLEDDVAANATVVASAVALLNGIKAALDAAIAANNPTALKALSDHLGANTSALAAAVAIVPAVLLLEFFLHLPLGP